MNTNIASNIDALAPTAPRTFIKTVAATGTPEKLTLRAVSSLTRAGRTVTVQTALTHHYAVGDQVVIAGATQPEYNGTFTVSAIVASSQFQYVLPGAAEPVTPATGTITVEANIWFRRATVYGKTTAQGAANATSVFLGESSSDGAQPIEVLSGGEVDLEPGVGARYNLRDFYADVGTALEGVVIVLRLLILLGLLWLGLGNAEAQITRQPVIAQRLFSSTYPTNWWRATTANIGGGNWLTLGDAAGRPVISLRIDDYPAGKIVYFGDGYSFDAWNFDTLGLDDGNNDPRIVWAFGSFGAQVVGMNLKQAVDNEYVVVNMFTQSASAPPPRMFAVTNSVRWFGDGTWPTTIEGYTLSGRKGNVEGTLPGRIWTQTGTRVVTNTTSATTLLTGAGTTNMPAASLNVVGRTLRFDFQGRYSTAATPGTFTIDVAIGATTIFSTGAITPVASQTEKHFRLSGEATVRTTGASATVQSAGAIEMQSATSTANTFPMLNASTTTHDLTAAQILHVRLTMSATTAPNNMQVQVGSIWLD